MKMTGQTCSIFVRILCQIWESFRIYLFLVALPLSRGYYLQRFFFKFMFLPFRKTFLRLLVQMMPSAILDRYTWMATNLWLCICSQNVIGDIMFFTLPIVWCSQRSFSIRVSHKSIGVYSFSKDLLPYSGCKQTFDHRYSTGSWKKLHMHSIATFWNTLS